MYDNLKYTQQNTAVSNLFFSVKNVQIIQNSMYSFKPPAQNLQQNHIQQGFNLGIKHRNQFDLVNGKMNMTNTK